MVEDRRGALGPPLGSLLGHSIYLVPANPEAVGVGEPYQRHLPVKLPPPIAPLPE